MKFVAGLLTTSAAVTGTLAAPRSGLADRVLARSGFSRQTNPLQNLGGDGGDSESRVLSSVAYSNNWAGAVREQPPPHAAYTAVSATFTVPKPTSVSGDHEAGSAWIGIDGDTYTTAILQAGVDFYTDGSNQAWYEWYPDAAHNFDNVKVSTGDTIVVKVQSFSPSQGVAIIENTSNGNKATQTINAPQPSATLAGENADWIIEAFQSGQSMVPLADFSSVTFSGVGAEGGGSHFGVSDATVIELKQNNKVLTNVDVEGDSQFTVNYNHS
ncbi:peptidase A4 family-domain-containing protein [Aspergillus ambiguus]|uniref:A4/G1 family peptidase n=1 Tax=Aspergillus ambiguus TaxID=176160 RepID=UPI003CCCCC66